MQTIFDFIQRVIKDLKLGDLAPNMQKTLELKIGEIVDEQVGEALAQSLTADDWKAYDDYRLSHPEAKVEEAMHVMVTHRPEIAQIVEHALATTYDEMMAQEAAVRSVLSEE